MVSEGESLGDAEKSAAAVLGKDLEEHLVGTEEAFNLIGRSLNSLPEVPIRELPQAEKVATSLLTRLANDLRCAALLAARGYAVQANALVASMFEVAFTVAYIGDDKELAQQWIDHDDPTRPFRSVRLLIDQVISRLDRDDHEALVSQHYITYRQLCMSKHANPLFQMGHGIRLEEGGFVQATGPDTSQLAVRAAWFAMEHALGTALVALESLMVHQLKLPGNHAMVAELAALSERRKTLNEAAISRWGNLDPYPGRWRE